MNWKWSDLAFAIALNGLAIAAWRLDAARSVAIQERDAARAAIATPADCPACKLRAEAAIPDPRELDECQP